MQSGAIGVTVVVGDNEASTAPVPVAVIVTIAGTFRNVNGVRGKGPKGEGKALYLASQTPFGKIISPASARRLLASLLPRVHGLSKA